MALVDLRKALVYHLIHSMSLSKGYLEFSIESSSPTLASIANHRERIKLGKWSIEMIRFMLALTMKILIRFCVIEFSL